MTETPESAKPASPSSDASEREARELDNMYWFRRQLHLLDALSTRARFLGIILIMLSVVNFIVLMYSLVLFDEYPPRIVIAYPFALLMMVIFCLLVFDTTRRRGNSMFDVISHALQSKASMDWDRGSEDPRIRAEIERLNYEVRIALRQYSEASEIPIIPGKFGGAVVLVINAILAILTVFLFR